jgi:DNA-binding MarR family transcriptional regulator
MSSLASDTQIAHEVLRVIRQIVRRISAHSKQLSSEIGLTVPQLMCLKAVGEMEEQGVAEITVAAVGHRVQLSPATVSRIVDRLVRVSLISRTRDEQDRRKVCLALTTSGVDRFHSLPTPLQEQFVERLRKLDEAERLVLLDSLRRLAELMDAGSIDAAPILHPGDLLPALSNGVDLDPLE